MIEQGSPEWFAQRLGKVTASRIADVMAKTKSGYSASRKNYLAQLVVERMTSQPQDGYQNAAMQWGVEHEAEAVSNYEFMTGHTIELAEFVDHPNIQNAGASPDRLVNADGLLEVKCPNTATHIETLLSGTVDNKYVLQMLWQMECTGRKWCDFVSFDPRMPAELQLFIQRVEFDAEKVGEVRREVISFLQELDVTIDQLNKLREAA